MIPEQGLPVQDDPVRSIPGANQDSSDLGYSLTTGSNAFVNLKQLLQDENEFHAINAAHNRPCQPFPPDFRSQALIAQLPSKPAIEELIAAYFTDVNWHYFILEKYYFDCILSCWYGVDIGPVKHLSTEELSKELRYFPALLFQVLALAIQFLPPGAPAWKHLSANDIALCGSYSDIGVELMTILGRPGVALTAVQADFLRSSWLKNIGRGVEAWHSVGNAIRSAQELGLHRQREIRQQGPDDIEKTLSAIWYEEYKTRLWMNLFIWDSLTAMILGRPRTINPDDCDLRTPMDCNIPKDPSTTVPMTLENTGNRDMPNSVSANLFLHQLSGMFHTMKALKADKPYPKDYSVVQGLHSQVNAILDGVPPTLRHENPDTSWDSQYPSLIQQREDILTKANLFFMALHRPHIVTHAESRRAALQAAIVTLESQHRSFAQMHPHHYKLFSLSFYTIDASILLSIVAGMYQPLKNEIMSNVDRVLRQAMDRLELMEAHSAMAKSGLGIVQRCYQKLKDCCEDASRRTTSGTTSAELPSFSPLELEDFRQGLNDQCFTIYSHQQQQKESQTDPYSHSGGMDLESMMGEVSESTTDFDESYWMGLINQIPAAPVSSTNFDGVWDSLLFD